MAAAVVHVVALQLAEHEVQHVVEVHANVGGNAKGFARVALPALVVPLAAAGDVGKLNVELCVGGGCGHLLAQLEDGGVVAQLQDVEDALARLLLHALQFIEQCGRGHQGFFANHVAAQAQAGRNVRVVQVVGAADGHVVKRGAGRALQGVGKFLEALEFGKKLALRRDAVDDAHRIVDVVGHGQVVAGVLDGTHVARRNVAGSANKGEIFHSNKTNTDKR